MSRLVVVSNRLTLPEQQSEAGGLAVALQEALRKMGGIWLGWSGNISASKEIISKRYGNIDYITADFTEKDYQDFYIDFCNSILWPLFHYRMDLTHFSSDAWEGYQRVNKLFADNIEKTVREDDILWVHDYQLITLGSHLRKRGLKHKIGFFLHIPFPVPEVMTALPCYRDILQGLCAYDVIGFQTPSDLQGFIKCITTLASGTVRFTGTDGIVHLRAFGKDIKAGCFPISIDTEEMIQLAEKAESSKEYIKLKKSILDRKLIIGVDRLDYSKGLMQRLESFGELLNRYPEHKNQVTYMQITPTSRGDVKDYIAIRQQLETIAGHINGEHSDIDWVPIRYINKSFNRRILAGFYRMANVGLVTPLRDGMNLVAKEYVASQNPADPGVLVLSQFAGAACELDNALSVNPFDSESMGKAIHQALTMPLKERQRRYEAMIEVLKDNTISHWTETFLRKLTGEPDIDAPVSLSFKSRNEGILLPLMHH